MEKHEKHADAARFAEEHPLSKSAGVDKKFDWAQQVCEFLNANYDDETVRAIRLDCACGPELGKGKKIREIYEKETDLTVFAEKVNRLNQGFSMEYDGEALYLTYPQCYCSCVKRMDKPLPAAWCYCSVGYIKRMFVYICGREVQVELLDSVKTGGVVCKFKITL